MGTFVPISGGGGGVKKFIVLSVTNILLYGGKQFTLLVQHSSVGSLFLIPEAKGFPQNRIVILHVYINCNDT